MPVPFRESRRKNGLLKASDVKSPLHTLYKANGEISPQFPKTLQALSVLDGKSLSSEPK